MHRLITTALALILLATAAPLYALSSGSDIIVPAAGRGGVWVTDLYVANPGDATVTGSIYWLVRDQANLNPTSIAFTLEPGETAVFEDIISDGFGLSSGNGAFRVTASDAVIVNSRIYATDASATFGQGFEGVPVTAATGAGEVATVVGLSYTSGFRTNVYATAGPAGADTVMRLVALDGTEIASASITLGVWQPYLRRVDQVFPGIANFDNATLTVQVSAGDIVAGASKVDNTSTDPTTLESDAVYGGGSGSDDGTYEISIYDSAFFAAGGNFVIENGVVTEINGTYFNWDKIEGGQPACTLQFLWGLGMSPTPLADFASGVTFSDAYYEDDVLIGAMEWTVSFTVESNMSITGTVTAVGSDFTDPDDLGCNGNFPPLVLRGGKTE